MEYIIYSTWAEKDRQNNNDRNALIIKTNVKMITPMEYTYIINVFRVILYTSLSLICNYRRYKIIVAKATGVTEHSQKRFVPEI
jgi:hypothetical protein